LRLAAQENQAAGIVLAGRLEGGPRDGVCGASRYDLFDAAARSVNLDAEAKLLDPAFGHDTA